MTHSQVNGVRSFGRRSQPITEMLDTSLHERRRVERMRVTEFRQAYERAAREIEQTDQVIQTLDALRVELGMSKG